MVTNESKLYFFFSVGCSWCDRASPHVEELNKEGHNILKLDIEDYNNRLIQNHLKTKFNISCGTPLFINTETGHYVCGYREKKDLLKWIAGEPVPKLSKPKSPAPRVPFHGRSQQEIDQWIIEYNQWKNENSHLPGLKTAQELLEIPRVKSQAPTPPPAESPIKQIEQWKISYREWMKENSHISGLVGPEQVLQRLQTQQNSSISARLDRIENILIEIKNYLKKYES